MAPLPSHIPDTTKFTTFLRNVVGIGVGYLPDTSPLIQHAFDYSLDLVNLDLGSAVAQNTSWSPYELAIYNLGAHTLIEYAPDVSYALSSLTWSGGIVRGVTTDPHSIQPGDSVRLIGVSPLGYSGGAPNAQLTVTEVTDNTHFGYQMPRNPGTATLLSNAAVQEQFFANVRQKLKLNSFVPGVVGSTSDLSTSVGLDNPDFFKHLTLADLQLLKTPYGRQYLSLAQKYGPTIWGLTR